MNRAPLLVEMAQGVVTVDEADEWKHVLERHRFRMSFSSFADLVERDR